MIRRTAHGRAQILSFPDASKPPPVLDSRRGHAERPKESETV